MMFEAPFHVHVATDDTVCVYDANTYLVFNFNTHTQLPLNDLAALAKERDEWVAWAEYLCRVLNQRRDNDVAIGEHAFRSGYEAAIVTAEADQSADWYAAWSEYDPPEELKGL